MKCAHPAVLGLFLAMASTTLAQDNRAQRQNCLENWIRSRLVTEQPVQLSATTVTLVGDTLRLVGRATVRFDDTTIRFEEIVLNQSSKRITFVGKGTISHGAASPCIAIPKIEYR